jgi:hypothetical protein
MEQCTKKIQAKPVVKNIVIGILASIISLYSTGYSRNPLGLFMLVLDWLGIGIFRHRTDRMSDSLAFRHSKNLY